MKYSTHNTYLNKEDIEVPSVTTILSMVDKPYLKKWANVMGFKRQRIEDILESSAAVGTIVHAAIEAYLTGTPLKFEETKHYTRDTVIRYLDPFIDWANEHVFEPVFVEKSMSVDQFGGTIDFYGKFDGKYTILDWKTSKQFNVSHFLQLSAYCYMLQEHGHIVDQAAIVRVNDGKIVTKFVTREELEEGIETFQSIVKFFHSYYDFCMKNGWKSAVQQKG